MHEEYDDLLLLYSANSLAGDDLHRLEAHLATCLVCRATLAEWRMLVDAVQTRAQTAAVTLRPLALPADTRPQFWKHMLSAARFLFSAQYRATMRRLGRPYTEPVFLNGHMNGSSPKDRSMTTLNPSLPRANPALRVAPAVFAAAICLAVAITLFGSFNNRPDDRIPGAVMLTSTMIPTVPPTSTPTPVPSLVPTSTPMPVIVPSLIPTSTPLPASGGLPPLEPVMPLPTLVPPSLNEDLTITFEANGAQLQVGDMVDIQISRREIGTVTLNPIVLQDLEIVVVNPDETITLSLLPVQAELLDWVSANNFTFTLLPPSQPADLPPNTIRGGFELGGTIRDNLASAAPYLEQAGMRWVKHYLLYTPGDDTDEAEAMIADAHAAGYKVMLEINGVPNDLIDEDYISEYAAFLGDIARLNPDAIQVWSEPNLDRSWTRGEIGGAEYADMLRAAYQAIKGANPDVMVVSAAPAPTEAGGAFPGQVMNDDQWLRELVAAGGLNTLDCVGANYVEGIVSPLHIAGDTRGDSYTRYFQTMLSTYTAIIGTTTPICWTEFGYLTGEGLAEPLPEPFAWASETTLAQQAQWLAEGARLSEASGVVRLMIVWNVDYDDNDPVIEGFAIVRPDGSCPACEALGR